ncbi:MAG: GLUG motif-containing protein, partial [Planctomycetota bacterium]
MRRLVVLIIAVICCFSLPAQGQYCSASSDSCAYEYISDVVAGTINNTGTSCSSYTDYTALSTSMDIGVGYGITVTNGDPDGGSQCGIWVDWNQDLDFDDSNETISVSGTPGVGPYTATITPPTGASVGDTRMRVRVLWDEDVNSCGTTDFGEVEDYTITVVSSDAGEIHGTKFHDLNGNGVRNGGEPGLEDWEIYIDVNDNGEHDTGEPNTMTDSNGYYELVELAADTYTVAEVLQVDWDQTYPGGDGTHTVIVGEDEIVGDVNFGNRIPVGYGGGSGTVEEPYLIYTAAQMNYIGANPNDLDKHFKLTADIDLGAYTGTSFNIVGANFSNAFTGVFDGNGHTISNFTYDSNGVDFIGFFGIVNGETAEIKDLGLIDPNVDAGTGEKVGALVGQINFGRISGCWVEGGSVSGSGPVVGGMVGRTFFATIANSRASCSVSGGIIVGGFVANPFGMVVNCYSTGNVSGTGDRVGGLIGTCAATVSNCYSTGSVSGADYVGGLLGSFTGPVINSYSTGSVSGSGSSVGGLTGLNVNNNGTVTDSFWDTETSGQATSAGGTGKTTAQMQDPNTFLDAGWDFVGETSNGLSDDWAEPNGGGYMILSWGLPENELPPLPSFSGGTGEANDPYIISTAIDLNSIGHNPRLMTAHFELVNDINLAGIVFSMIGGPEEPFAGVFDGNGHEIFDFSYVIAFEDYFTESRDLIGLFKVVSGPNAQIKDLALRNFEIDAGIGGFVGSLVGRLRAGSISGCYVDGNSVSGSLDTGGLVGKNYGTISNCYANINASGVGPYGLGVLVGENGGLITNCKAAGKVLTGNSAGGLVGRNNGDGTISTCTCSSIVSGVDTLGGLIGENSGLVSNSFSVGDVNGRSEVGGLVGQNYEDGIITLCYSTGDASGDGLIIGGLVGENTGQATISNCYAKGAALGTGEHSSYIGGLVGENADANATISNCYSTGSVSGDNTLGGLVGDNSGTVEYSFWDKQTSGRSNSAGGTGKMTSEMQTESTFTDAGWDFVWEV